MTNSKSSVFFQNTQLQKFSIVLKLIFKFSPSPVVPPPKKVGVR